MLPGSRFRAQCRQRQQSSGESAPGGARKAHICGLDEHHRGQQGQEHSSQCLLVRGVDVALWGRPKTPELGRGR